MKQLECDVLIVGSGLSGIIAASALSLLNIKIIIVDQKNISSEYFSSKLSKTDTRTTAIAEGSKFFLDEISLWKNLSKYAEPIKKIKVIDRRPNNTINFSNSKKNKNLGYVIKNNNFIHIVLKELIKRKNVTICNNLKLQKIDYSFNKIICGFNNIIISSNLLVAADGKNSTVRSIKNTGYYKKDYDEKALVVNFEHLNNHNSCAYEFFYENGPLAILPMQKELNFQSSLIWSNKSKYLESLLNVDENLFKKILEEKIIQQTGKIKKIKSKQIFQLSAHLNYKFYEKRIVYVGDAAHSIHPIAGQGWNLGLRDVMKLYMLLNEYINLGLEINTIEFCKKYNQECYYDSYILFQITDKLNSLFMVNNKIINSIRGIGFNIIQKKTLIKDKISNFAMGF